MFLKKWITGCVLLLTMAVFLTSLGAGVEFANSATESQPMETVNVIEAKLLDDSFFPNVITIPNGTTTTIKLKNEGNKEHTFTVKNLGIDAEVQPGTEKTITVKPSKPGTYELICRYHFQQGMVGKVIVK